jgi:hypothetical protein
MSRSLAAAVPSAYSHQTSSNILTVEGEGTTTISNPNVTVNGATGAEITALTEITAGPLASAETSTDVREVQPQRPYVGHARWARHW